MEKTSVGLWSRNFTLLVIGQIMSLFGNMVITTALPFHILNISGSASLYGLVMGLPVVSLIIMTPLGGIMADRFKKHRLMFWLDVSITAIIVAYMLFSGLFADVVAVVIVKLLAFNAIQAIYMATTASSISLLVPQDKLPSGNAVVTVVNMLSMTAGMAIAGILYDNFGLFPILVGCAICFGITAIVDLFIRIPYEKQETTGNVFQIVKGDLAESLRFIFKEKPATSKILYFVFFMEFIFGSMIIIGLPVLITVHLGMSMTHVGVALAIMMAGGIAGGIIAGAMGTRLNIKKGLMFIVVGVVCAVPMGLIFLLSIPDFLAYVIVIASGTIFMLAGKVMSISMMTYIQVETPNTLIGKVLSVLMVAPFIGQSLGYPVVGRLFEMFAESPWVVVFGSVVGMMVAAIIAYKHFKKAVG
jgi:MFS family permease